MNVVIRVDASLRIGTGHFTRCLTLANALKRGGAKVLFICRHVTDFMRDQIRDTGHDLVVLPPREDAADGDLAHSAWLAVPQVDDATDTLAALRQYGPIDWLVVDHYGLDARWEKALRPAAARLLALDDIADRPHDADLLLDQNLQDTDQDRYAGLLPATCRRLIGPRFALLRPEFQALAAAQPKRRDRVNIFFGGVDPDGMTVRATKALDCATLRAVPADIVIGIDNPHRACIAALVEKLPGATLHIQPANLGVLMNRARLALGGGGATSWERCCLAVPTAIVSIAENQKSGCRALARARAAIYLGDIAQLTADCIARAVQDLLGKPRLLVAMSRRAGALVDGRGTDRVALCLMRDRIAFRPAEARDAEAKWRWRNDERTRRYFNDPGPVALSRHLAWWQDNITSGRRALLIAHSGHIDVGVLRFDFDQHSAMVSIYLDPDMTGLGLGPAILRAGMAFLHAQHPDVWDALAEIDESNAASATSFARAGFRKHTDRLWKRTLP